MTSTTSLRVAAAVVLSASFLAACRSNSPAPAPVIPPDTWAVVDGHAISKAEVDKAYRRAQDPSQKRSDEDTLHAKLNLLDQLIVQEILLAKARALQLDVPESEVDTAYANAKKGIADEAFQQELAKRGLTTQDLRDGLKRDLVSQKVIDREAAKVEVTEQEINAFFDANRARFSLPEEAYHIAQIVITPVREPAIANTSGDDAMTPEAAEAKVRLLMERLQSGTPFPELAAAFSEDPESARRGGDMGFVPVSQLKKTAPALQGAVIGKSPGTATVATVNGVHTIVFVLEHELAGQRDLSTPGVRERITEGLRSGKEQLVRTAYITAVKTDADVVNYLARRLVESKGRTP